MATSWLMTGIGRFTTATWQGEMASIGIRGICSDAGSPSHPFISQSLPSFDAVAAGTSASTTHTTANYGSVGVGNYHQTNQNSMAEAMWTYLNTIKAYQTSNFAWQEIRLSAVTNTGSIVNGASVFTITAPLAGTATITAAQPPQAAMVVSVQTGGRGPRNRGRQYVPIHQGSVLNGDGVFDTTSRTAVRGGFKTLVDSINALTGIRAAVVSVEHQTYSDITNLRTGDEVDTQRKRRNYRRESYTSSAVTS